MADSRIVGGSIRRNNAGGVKTFISHVVESKVLAANIRDELSACGFDAFVAHEEIEPTRRWESEFWKSLDSMKLMVALSTAGFKESNWTGQELGFALARNVPIIPIRIGTDPFGFIAKIQAISRSQDHTEGFGRELFKLMLANESENLRTLGNDALVCAVCSADNFNEANELAAFLPDVTDLLPGQVASIDAFRANSQLRGSFKFPRAIAHCLTRITGATYTVVNDCGQGQILKRTAPNGL